ncbi:MAG: cytochrome C biogenesis protein [Bacteroidetes bacterium]|nr:MAG: cytochrome C biogenesis protein [Bacteroidota bacterium]
MTEIQFSGEHLLIGNVGKVAIFLSFAAAIFSFISYFLGVQLKEESKFWKTMGRFGFGVHGISVATIFITLFLIIQNHYFEYQYAYQHSSTDLPLRYMISCFWEGQEGSFLLWMVWHAILGGLLIWKSKNWEAPVMAIVALSQVMLSSMLLGIEIGDYKLGSNPFILLREYQPGIFNIPVMARFGAENYLKLFTEGNGLNPLLQNYWMVIHPPTLFLGFAAAIVPFAYAVAGLWTKQHKEWVKPAIPWTLFGVMILGTGIIMGGFWAYESLSFGGYWAWDPVENASLIPWLLLIALAHTMLIHQRTGKALYITYILAIFSFLLVLYATFLTRSGILGNTSVHAFTDLGMSGQLLLFFFLFIAVPSLAALKTNVWKWTLILVGLTGFLLSFVMENTILVGYPVVLFLFGALFVSVYQSVPEHSKADEELSSREFWMLIGALVFILSCFFVGINTSMPVWNKIVPGLDKAPPVDVVGYYNRWMMPFALIIGLMVGFGQFLKYKKTNPKKFWMEVGSLALASAGFTILFAILFHLKNPLLISFLFAAVFAVIGNLVYIFKVLKGKISLSGGSIAHVGFGFMLIGVISSGAGKNTISINRSRIDFGEAYNDQEKRENILLSKNIPMLMGDYLVTYIGDTTIAPNTHYYIRYQGYDIETESFTGEEFVLEPNAQVNPKMGLVSNPDTRHYLTHDVFTHITQIPDLEANRKAPFSNFKEHVIRIGDTIFTNNGIAILKLVTPNVNPAQYGLEDAEHMLVAELEVRTLSDTLFAHPVFAIKGDNFVSLEDDLHEAGLRFKLNEIRPDPVNADQTKFVIETGEKPAVQEYVILKAMIFPYINFLWGGTIIMVFGFTLSIFQRARAKKLSKVQQDLEAGMYNQEA